MMLQIKDRDRAVPVATMKGFFEQAVKNTPLLQRNTPLGEITVNGKFSHYADPNTDTLWIGFALGMRCAQRAAAQGDGQ